MSKTIKRNIFQNTRGLSSPTTIADDDLIVFTIRRQNNKETQYIMKYSAFKTLILADISDGSFTYDTIVPLTAGSGVTVDGVLIKSNNVYTGDGTVSLPAHSFASDTDSGFYRIAANNIGLSLNGAKVLDFGITGLAITGILSTTGVTTFGARNTYKGITTITAFAGGGQASATAITGEYNNVTVCATSGDSVLLPVAALGAKITIKNNGAADLAVFPTASGTINGGSAAASIVVPVGSTKIFEGTTSLNWETYGILTTALGTVSRPSHTFNSQSDQGMYSVSSSQLGMAVSGALATLFDTSGIKSDSIRNRVNLGTTPVGTVSIVEYSNGKDVTTVLTLTNFIVGALAGAAAALGVGNIVYAYPAGQHFELVDSFSSIVLTAAGTAVATKTGLGSVIASGAVSVLSGTATFENRLAGQTISTAAGGGAAVDALLATTAGIGTGIALNVSGSIKNVFLNSAGTWNANNTGNLTATGTIVLKWTKMS